MCFRHKFLIGSDLLQLALSILNTFLNLEAVGAGILSGEVAIPDSATANASVLEFASLLIYNDSIGNALRSDHAGASCFNNEKSRYDVPESMSYFCPYANSLGFRAIQGIFGIYFLILIIQRIYASSRFPIDDYRNFLFIDQFNDGCGAKTMFYTGMIVIGGLCGYGIFFALTFHGTTGFSGLLKQVMPLLLWFYTSVILLEYESQFVVSQDSSIWADFEETPLPMVLVPTADPEYAQQTGLSDWWNLIRVIWSKQNFWDELGNALVRSLALRAGRKRQGGGSLALEDLTSEPDRLLDLLVMLKEDVEPAGGAAGAGGDASETNNNSNNTNNNNNNNGAGGGAGGSDQKYLGAPDASASDDNNNNVLFDNDGNRYLLAGESSFDEVILPAPDSNLHWIAKWILEHRPHRWRAVRAAADNNNIDELLGQPAPPISPATDGSSRRVCFRYVPRGSDHDDILAALRIDAESTRGREGAHETPAQALMRTGHWFQQQRPAAGGAESEQGEHEVYYYHFEGHRTVWDLEEEFDGLNDEN